MLESPIRDNQQPSSKEKAQRLAIIAYTQVRGNGGCLLNSDKDIVCSYMRI
nr:MAG TPA: hypothetical protein [Caudoviricetes sp.]DAM97924.1 MAG TPA: hypothetical protein [Caudoviricetes sp.]